MSEKYLKMIWGDPDAPQEDTRNVDIVEEDRFTGNNDMSGAV